MTERLNTEDCISKVYQFLSDYKGNWKADADTNGDDTIIQTEFRGFMIKNQSGWNEKWDGEWKYDSEDIINKFWKSINTETRGLANVKGTCNKIALDDKEIKNMEKNVIIADLVREFVSKKSVPDQSWSTQLANSWKESIKASLSNKVRAHFQGVDFSTMTEEQLKNDINAYLQENGEQLYKDSERITTADIYKQLAIENAGAILNEYKAYGYDANSDPDLNSLIEAYVQSIKNNPNVTLDEMEKAINLLVNDYLQTAGLGDRANSGNNVTFRDNNGNSTTYTNRADRLSRYGYNSSGLNGLQTAVLKKGMIGEIVEQINANNDYKQIYQDSAYTKSINAKIAAYVEEYINSNASKGFEEIQKMYENVATSFIETNMKTIKDDIDNQITLLGTARKDLKEACKYGKKYEEALKAVFDGKTEKEAIENYIDAETDITVLQSKKSDITARISAIDSKPTTVTDKSEAVYDNLSTIINKSAKMTYRILNDGTIEFVEYDNNGGVFAASKSTTVQYYFNKVKTELEASSGYKEELEDIFGNDELAKKNLFNMALLATLSDVSVVEEPYNEMILQQVVISLIQNYRKLLQNAANNENTRNYILNYSNISMVAGRTLATERDGRNIFIDNVGGTMTKNMNDYYKDDSTYGSDDWVDCDKQKDHTYTCIGGSGSILFVTSDCESDDKAVNDALVKVLNDYVAKNKAYMDVNKIIQLFREAEETAFAKLKQTKHHSEPGKSQIYGYSECGEFKNARGEKKNYDDYDTWSGEFHSVQSILLEVMYEMDSLILREMLK